MSVKASTAGAAGPEAAAPPRHRAGAGGPGGDPGRRRLRPHRPRPKGRSSARRPGPLRRRCRRPGRSLSHAAVRRFAPRADGTLLGLVTLLNGIGFVTIARLDPELARYQSLWTAVGVVAFVVTLRVVKRIRDLERYRYTFALVGIVSVDPPGHPRHRTGDQRRPALGGARAAQLPARRGGQGPAGDLPGRLFGGEAGAAVDPHLAGRAVHAARPQALRPAAAGLGQLDPGHGPGEGPRLVVAVLRRVPGHGLHGHRPGQLRRYRRRPVRGRGDPRLPDVRPRPATGSPPGSTPGPSPRTRASSWSRPCSPSAPAAWPAPASASAARERSPTPPPTSSSPPSARNSA